MIGITKPHTFRAPRDMRHSARPRRAGDDGQNDDGQPGTPSGPVSGRDLYVQHRMGAMTTAPSSTRGLIKTATHDTDAGGGLHTSSLNDMPTRSGGYGSMNQHESSGLQNQFLREHGQLSAGDQAAWDAQARRMNQANGYDDGSPASSRPAAPAGLGGISHYTTPGQVPAQPPAKADSTPADDSEGTDAFGTDALSLLGSGVPSKTMGVPYRPTEKDPAAPAAPAPSTPQDPASVQRAMQDARQIDAGGAVGNGPGGYGKVGQVNSPDASQDATTTDAAGNRHVDTAGGGTVDIPASQPQTAPADTLASNGAATGIYRDGIEQRKMPGQAGEPASFAPARLADSPTGTQPADDADEEGSAKAYFPLRNPFSTGGRKSGGLYA